MIVHVVIEIAVVIVVLAHVPSSSIISATTEVASTIVAPLIVPARWGSSSLLILAPGGCVLGKGAEGVVVGAPVLGRDLLLSEVSAVCWHLFDKLLRSRGVLRRIELDERLPVEIDLVHLTNGAFHKARPWGLRRGKKIDLPFALAIDLVFAKGQILDTVFTSTLFQPAPDIVVGRPPVQFGDHQCWGGTRVE